MSKAQELVMKVVTIVVLVILACMIFWPNNAEAGKFCRHCVPAPVPQPTVQTTMVENTYFEQGVSESYVSEGIAKAAACSGTFYFGSTRFQTRFDGAHYNNENAICIQGFIRLEDSNVAIDFGIAPDDDTDYFLYRGGVLVVW